jgi:hypothetical protein
MQSSADRGTRADAALLAAVQAVTVGAFVARLGFSSDDWWFLARMDAAASDGLLDLYRAAQSPFHAMRPLFIGLLALLFKLFGLHPLGYHLVNAGLLWASALGLYAVARRFLPRTKALALALVFLVLPEYGTVRYWMTAAPLTLSLALFTFSVYAELRAVEAEGEDPARVRVGWKALSMAALVAGNLAYELFLPLALVNVLLSEALLRRRAPALRPVVTARVVSHACTAAVVVAIAAFKWATTVRLGPLDLPERLGGFGELLAISARIAVFDYGLGLPKRVARLAVLGSSWLPALGALAAGLLAGASLLRIAGERPPVAQDRGPALRLIAAGGLVFMLGYAIFLTNANAQVTTTGIGNRIAMASSLGAAMAGVGAIDLVTGWIRSPRGRTLAFASLVGAACAGWVFIVQALARYWTEAPRHQERIVQAIQQRWPTLPPGTTLLLDGSCPYLGPAIVFESNWDLASALQIRYGDPSLKADVASAHLRVEDGGLRTVLYGRIESRYPWSRSLVVFDVRGGSAAVLADADAASSYFAAHPRAACPPGLEGIGSPVF